MKKIGILICFLLFAACAPEAVPVADDAAPTQELVVDEETPAAQAEIATPEATEPVGGTSPSVPDEFPNRAAITSLNYAYFGLLMEFPVPDVVRAVTFSPDSRLMAASIGNSNAFEVYVWDIELQEVMLVLRGHDGIVWDVAFSPDGKEIASSSADGTVRIWRTADGALLRVLQHPADISSIAFSPDGTILAAGGVKEWPVAAVWLYDTETWLQMGELEAAWNIPAIVFFPERGYIVGGGISRNVSVWSEASGEELFLLYHPGQVSALDRDRDGDTLITAPCTQADGSACAGSELWAWDMASGTIAGQVDAGVIDVSDLDVSPLGDLLVTVGRDRFIRLHAVDDLHLVAFFDSLKGALNAVAFSPDATLVGVGASDVVQVWGYLP